MPGNRVRIAAFLAAVLLFSTAAVGVVAGQNAVTLEVTVVDGNGDGVSGVDLTATWDGGSDGATTSSNGKALLDVPEGADVTVTVDDDRYVRNAPYELENASGGAFEVPVALAGTATVDVVDRRGPVSGAIVRLERDGTTVLNTRTGSDGSTTTDDVERGEYRATVWKEGYLRNRTTVTVDGDVSATVTIREDSRLLTVNVTDDHFSPARPVPDATVAVEGVGNVTTLSNGQTTLQVPVNAKYDVTVSKPGYERNATTVRVGESQLATNLTVQRTDAITVTPANRRVVVGETVRVTVTDEYGDPVTGATVRVDGASAGETDDQGVTTVAIDAAGEHALTATSGSLEANATVEGVQPGGGDTEGTATRTVTATTTSDGGGPGFSVAGALVALVAVGLLTRRS